MELARKIEIAAEAIKSISRHEDEDAAVRLAMLDEVAGHIEAEKKRISERVALRVEQLQRAP